MRKSRLILIACGFTFLSMGCYSVSNTGWSYTDFEANPIESLVTDSDNTPISVRDDRGWELAFSDEFNDSTVDLEKWLVVQDHEDKRYHQDNVYQRDGKLVLAVDTIDNEVRAARIDTRDTFQQQYGVFEVRAKIDQVEDTIFALWLSNYPGVSQVGNDGRDGAEIDIIETGYQSDSVIHTLHWDGYGRHHQSHSTGKFDIPIQIHQGFHVYGLEWTRDMLYLFVDGVLTATYEAEGIPWVEEFVILSSEHMSHWEGDSKNADFPVEFEVDWVRVYQQYK